MKSKTRLRKSCTNAANILKIFWKCIVQLKEPLNIQSNNLRKLELPEDKTFAGEMAVVTGYGWNWVDVTMNALTERAEESGGSHQKLRFANAKVLSSAECQKNYVKNIVKQNICARVVQRQPSKPEGVCSVSTISHITYLI